MERGITKLPAARLLATLLGIVFAVLLLEVGLRLAGIAAEQGADHGARPSHPDGLTVLCLGDSFTAGTGAPKGDSYPEQLERWFASQPNSPEIRVVNAGRVTQNTNQLWESLDPLLDQHHPDVVTLLTGGANTWNFIGFQNFLRGEATTVSRSWDALHRLRTVRLARLVMRARDSTRGVRETKHRHWDPSDAGWRQLEAGANQAAMEHFQHSLDRGHRQPEALFGLASSHQRLGDTQAAWESYEAGLNALAAEGAWPTGAPPYTSDITGVLGAIQSFVVFHLLSTDAPGDPALGSGGDPAPAPHDDLASLDEALSRAQHDRPLYDSDGHLLAESRQDEALLSFRKALELQTGLPVDILLPMLQTWVQLDEGRSTLPPGAATGLEGLVHEQQIAAWIRSDIIRAVRLVESRGATAVLQGYPAGFNLGWDMSPTLLEDIATELGVPFVNHAEAFDQLTDRAAHFATDGHCNERGYGLMAKTLGPTVSQQL